MQRTKILLADLAHTHSVGARSLTVPLGIGYVKAYAFHELGSSVDIHLFKHPEKFLAAVEEGADIVGFANYGWNQNLNLAIGRHVRSALPRALILAGGPNIDPEPDRRWAFMQKHDYLDGLIIDGGEEPFTELVSWHRDKRTLDDLPANVVWRDAGQLVTTRERKLEKIIGKLPSPYLAGYLDEFLAAGMIPLFETNRGCPFQCTFCAWGSASKDLVRRIDLDQALAEISYVGERSTARNWIVCDANFGILPRDVEVANAVRAVHEKKGLPKKCHIWLAKNVTERNLAIGEILGDMIQPVMAVQSLDQEVLKHIKRDNISLATYEEYQKKFHRIGSLTYSDMIVPLPKETLASHLAGLRILMNLGVDRIQNHNMRLLSGAETNSLETRAKYAFATRYRLIHGDAGVYRTPGGVKVEAFEYEESLRSTASMCEADVFYLRKLHFLVDFCWNVEVYKPLLRLGQLFGESPIDVLTGLLKKEQLSEFFAEFDRCSREEWFDSEHEIESHFAQPENFQRLLDQEFEKLNIQFCIIALRDHKAAFDLAIAEVLAPSVPAAILREVASVTFAIFPSLGEIPLDHSIDIPSNLPSLDQDSAATFQPATDRKTICLTETPARASLRRTITQSRGATLSKILNTQGISLSELRLATGENLRFDGAFRPAV